MSKKGTNKEQESPYALNQSLMEEGIDINVSSDRIMLNEAVVGSLPLIQNKTRAPTTHFKRSPSAQSDRIKVLNPDRRILVVDDEPYIVIGMT